MSRPVRRKKLVDVTVQGALVRRIILHWMVFLVVTAVVAFMLQVLSNPLRPLSFHVHNLSWTHGPLIIVMVFLLPVFVVDTIKISHRFAGPIYGLRRAMWEVNQGHPPRQLRFRSSDFWHDVAEEYNAMLTKLGAQVDEKNVITDDELVVASGEPSSK